jgi:hypothetical protein
VIFMYNGDRVLEYCGGKRLSGAAHQCSGSTAFSMNHKTRDVKIFFRWQVDRRIRDRSRRQRKDRRTCGREKLFRNPEILLDNIRPFGRAFNFALCIFHFTFCNGEASLCPLCALWLNNSVTSLVKTQCSLWLDLLSHKPKNDGIRC